ncbi:DUF1963 domain-containing protein [Aquimarina algicola]|uniref:DUF1963 domain-containing protein n=1 Tax=Aquimarina algicola TaxID=2589995 RepID=A0A504J7E9_9FLAO|nr:DUF1963 domain-containing protein [Aquimarina algicola]TPN86786.1 DUF1963 domain-containing protein [Aquimarina algicola]
MKEYCKVNTINVGFANHSVEGTIYLKGALDTEVLIRKGKLRINILTPSLELTEDLHNGMLNNPDVDNNHHIDWLRFTTYHDLVIPEGKYNTQIKCPYGDTAVGFEVYGFPELLKFYGVIDVQKGYVHIKGELRSEYRSEDCSIPIDILKKFIPKDLLPPRTQYTWNQALQQNPLEVYGLAIGKGVFDAFPEKLLTFKNLEDLWIGGQTQFNVKELPDTLFSLVQLHTIRIYGSSIHQISDKVNQLKNLEELCIESSQLKTIPDSICELPLLSDLSFRYNKLIELPECIGTTPNLKMINIEGNYFKKIPKSITAVPSIKVDRKYQKLFMDTSYRSNNPDPIDESLFDLSYYPEEKIKLKNAIESIPEVTECSDLILDYTTMATYLMPDKEDKNIAVGASKVGGNPDLPKTWEHPKSNKGSLYVFHAQINCEEASSYQKYLPRKGMLYFFVNDEEYAQKPIVLYTENVKDLLRYQYDENTEFTDSNLDNNIREAVRISFKNGISIPIFYNLYNHGSERYPKYADFFEDESNEDIIDDLEYGIESLENVIDSPLSSGDPNIPLHFHSINSHVFTQHESPQELAAARFGGEPSEWIVLLNMESTGEFNFWDAGTLTYCIHKKDLAIKDFSRVFASIESS